MPKKSVKPKGISMISETDTTAIHTVWVKLLHHTANKYLRIKNHFLTLHFFLMSLKLNELYDLIDTLEKQQQQNHDLIESMIKSDSQYAEEDKQLTRKLNDIQAKYDDLSKQVGKLRSELYCDSLERTINDLSSKLRYHPLK